MNQHTWTGSWGSVPYWNAFVANLEMHGKGNYNTFMKLGLTTAETRDLIEYLLSL